MYRGIPYVYQTRAGHYQHRTRAGVLLIDRYIPEDGSRPYYLIVDPKTDTTIDGGYATINTAAQACLNIKAERNHIRRVQEGR